MMIERVSGIAGALLLSLAGLWLAYGAWRVSLRRPAKLIGAIGLWLVSTILWCLEFGAEIGIPLAIETGALCAFVFILARAERRENRAARDRFISPPPSPERRRLRGVARFVIGGPIGLAAALGIGLLFGTRAPLHEQTRLILGGLIVPSLWAAIIIYVLVERRLWRSGGALAFTAAAGFGITILAAR